MILEGIVSTLNEAARINIAPMGPDVDSAEPTRFVLRPFRSSTTYRNLLSARVGVLHVTDDVLLLARAAIGDASDEETVAATSIEGRIIKNTCRYYEFKILEIDDSRDRAEMIAETVCSGRFREFFGFNRAKHAVVEAAVLATRLEFLPIEKIVASFRELSMAVEKTGGDSERAAFRLLSKHVLDFAAAKNVILERFPT